MPSTPTPAETPTPFRFVDQDEFCLSARLLPDLNTGQATNTLSVTIEGSDEPQSVHVPVGELPAVLAGIAGAAVLPVVEADEELTAEEARTLADDLNRELYEARDALAFVEECCVIADRDGRTVTTAEVREWLKGARCGRQLDVAQPEAVPDTGLRDRASEAAYPCPDGDTTVLGPELFALADRSAIAWEGEWYQKCTPADRTLRAECDAIEADYHGQHDDVAVGARAAVMRIRARVGLPADHLRRLADEAQQPAPCGRSASMLTPCSAGDHCCEGPAGAHQEPIQLRWGLDDVMLGDDDTTTLMLSGPDGEPYWLELDAERAAALRDSLTGPGAEEPTPAPQCSAGLLPATDAAVDRCVRHGAHDTHVTAAGARWPNEDSE